MQGNPRKNNHVFPSVKDDINANANANANVNAYAARGSIIRKKRNKSTKNLQSSLRNMYHQFDRRRSSINELSEYIKPETALGWITFLTSISTAIIIHELRLQQRLTCPPLVYSQDSPLLQRLKHRLSHNPNSKDQKGILTRDIKPTLLVGTRGTIASTAAYLLHGPSQAHQPHLSFREVMTMADGATIALDWEVPLPAYKSTIDVRTSTSQLKANVLYGPIVLPVVIILHGINNDTGFGYMKNLMRSVADRGWIACGMNFRGCGGEELKTPRGYNAAYTGDLRNVVLQIQARLRKITKFGSKEKDGDVPVFLVGNSLGANLITKYLGEEGFSGTLPECIKGGVSLGNPLHIHSGNVKFPFNVLLGAGVKKTILQSWKVFSDMSSCWHFGDAVRQVMLSKTIGELDDAIAPFLIRNDTTYPFSTKIGYENGEDYWRDASSNRYIQHVQVPLLLISSRDDSLVVNAALQSLARCLENPNVLVVKTKCGGHLGWHEAPPGGFGVGKSWADSAMADFIEAVLDMRTKDMKRGEASDANIVNSAPGGPNAVDMVESIYASRNLQSKL
jgi:predicted alpha/beta-fold hydrolase